MSQYWTIITANVRREPTINSTRVTTVPMHQIVSVLDISKSWAFIEWRNFKGWLYLPLIEKVNVKLGEVEGEYEDVVFISPEMIPAQRQTGRQYLLVDGKTRPNYNLCGQFCAAYVGKIGIREFLDKWYTQSPANYSATVSVDRGTGIATVRDMLRVFGKDKTAVSFTEGLRDTIGGILVSPGRISEKLKTHDCIIGVKINNRGEIKSTGIGHWVCLTSVEPFEINDGMTEIYNPFPNKFEEIPYREIMSSMGNWSGLTGLWIEK